jgi:hypothetical protein
LSKVDLEVVSNQEYNLCGLALLCMLDSRNGFAHRPRHHKRLNENEKNSITKTGNEIDKGMDSKDLRQTL